jgi:non-ribosomal peptide synthetase component F
MAILKAGGAYVPLDPAYPSDPSGSGPVDAEPVLVLTDAAGRTVLGEAVMHAAPCSIWSMPNRLWLTRHHPDTNPDASAHGLTSRHLAYVIYTSGSTGTPKGVMVEHRSTRSP